jgi:signal transduction histidine kinase
MLDRLDRSFTQQRRFVADASHELRTPFAAMRAQVDVALDGDLDQQQLRDTLLDIGQVLDRGSALVNAMLALSRAETLSRRAPVDLGELVAEVVTATAGVERLDVRTRLEPATVHGDPVLLEQLVHNLVRNAVAYNTDGGRLEITTTCTPSATTLRIANDGPHIAPDEAEALLSRFHRGSSTERAPGYGLGLSIVTTIATAHHADLAVHTRPTGGLDISVTFPGGSRDDSGAHRIAQTEHRAARSARARTTE